MCANCGINANCRTTAVLTWAVPVDVVELGASLKAYHSLKPMVTQFRLCHRFGQGPNAFLNRLPQELVDIVLEYLIIPSREVQEIEWNSFKACAEYSCSPRDHYTAEAIREMEEEVRMEILSGEDDESDDEIEVAVDSYVNDSIGDMDSTYETCELRQSEWESMTCVSKGFADLDKILGLEFGLSAHIAHQSITKPLVRLFYPNVNDSRECVATQAYLTLPSPGLTHKLKANEVCSREYMDYYDCEGKLAFFNIIDPASLQITKEKIQRFRQAMRFLGLTPSLIKAQIASLDHGHHDPILPKHKETVETKNYTAKGLTSLREDVQKRLDEQEKSEWPKLMQLVKSSYELP